VPVPNTDGPERSPEQVDAEFARIVAGFDTPVPTSSWPGVEDTTVQSGPDLTADRLPGPIWPAAGPVLNRPPGPRSVDPDGPSLLDGLDTFGAGLPDSDLPDTFVPPPPPPVPRIPFAVVISVLAILGGFYLFFDRSLLGDYYVSMLVGLAGILGGAAGLIMRLRPGGEDDEPPADDGAVV
jgi:hypothetical protein